MKNIETIKPKAAIEASKVMLPPKPDQVEKNNK